MNRLLNDMACRWERTCRFWKANFKCSLREVLVTALIVVMLATAWIVS